MSSPTFSSDPLNEVAASLLILNTRDYIATYRGASDGLCTHYGLVSSLEWIPNEIVLSLIHAPLYSGNTALYSIEKM